MLTKQALINSYRCIIFHYNLVESIGRLSNKKKRCNRTYGSGEYKQQYYEHPF